MRLLPSVVYVALHLVAYVLVVRRSRASRTERGIFLYHAVSFGLLVGGTSLAALIRPADDALACVVFAAGLHGVYSLSFLEAWSLTDGSYSLQILAAVDGEHGAATAESLGRLAAVGESKQSDRTGALRRLHLLRADGNLTAAGAVAAAGLRTVLWLTRGRPTN